MRVFVSLNLSGIGLKQPTGKGMIGKRGAVLDRKLGIQRPGMGMQRGIRAQKRFRLTRAQSGSVALS